jgi:hypothetical protein
MLVNLENPSGIEPPELADIVMVLAVNDRAVEAELEKVVERLIGWPGRLDCDALCGFDGVVVRGFVPDNLSPDRGLRG